MDFNARPKRVIAINDISGFGRCSLTVAIPVLSAMGYQVCPVPTAVLSCHTAYKEYKMKDLTDFMSDCLQNWKNMAFEFECIYTGFLASDKQIDKTIEYLDTYSDALVVVDPVMGDDGKIYKTVTEAMKTKMRMLAEKADLITPNLTEAAILLNEKYPENGITMSGLKDWLSRLADMGPQYAVITGVKTNDGKYMNAGFDKLQGKYWGRYINYIPKTFYGTGDTFASVLTGSILDGKNLKGAMADAIKFIDMCIENTTADKEALKDGIYFEPMLDYLCNSQRKIGLIEL